MGRPKDSPKEGKNQTVKNRKEKHELLAKALTK
jgi:hypothetical protein